MEIKFAYNQNGETIEKEFEDYLDLVEFVALKGVKDEDFVSMKLDDEEITGGINGLALYALRKVNNIREARKAAEEDMAEDEEFDEEDFEEPVKDDIYGEDNERDLQSAIDDFEDFLNSHTGDEFN